MPCCASCTTTTTRFDEEDVGNSFLQIPLLDYVKAAHPRVLFVGYGETDNWAHQGRYDLVLDSAHRMDHFVQQLWDTMQAMPQYHGTTTFIITTDHGRGSGPTEWKEHGVGAEGFGEYLDRGAGPGYRAAWRAHPRRPGDPGADRRDGGRVRRQGLSP